MRKHPYLIGTAAAVAMLAGAADLRMAHAGQPILVAAADAVDTTNLVGRTVVDSKGTTLGKIDSVLVDAGGKVHYVVVGVGGFLGIGDKIVALRWDELSSQNGDKLVADLTKEQLTAMPGYKYADAARRGTVYPYSDDLAANPYLADSKPTVTASATAEAPPFPGANSFTESQARSRIEGEGFSAVSELRKDDQGIWRGTAMKDGKNVSVALDYKGNVVAQ